MSAIPESVREFVAGGLGTRRDDQSARRAPRQPVLGRLRRRRDRLRVVLRRQRAARLRRDPRVTLSFRAKDYDGGALFPYLVVNGRATVEEGGALAVMDHLAQWYIGPGATYPARDMPAGWTFRVAHRQDLRPRPVERPMGRMDRASRGESAE